MEGRKRTKHLSCVQERRKRAEGEIKRGWQIEKTVEVERLRREGTFTKIYYICSRQRYTVVHFPTLSLYTTKYLLPAQPLTKCIPQYSQLGCCRCLSGCPGRNGVRPRRRWHRGGYSYLRKCKASANMFFQPRNCFCSFVSGIAPGECNQLVQPCGNVHIHDRDLLPCARGVSPAGNIHHDVAYLERKARLFPH